MIDFAIAKNMAISSTLFQHKRIHKETWRSPDEFATNQIDHVMIDSRQRHKYFGCKIMKRGTLQ